jgi:hypothetical protein
MISHSRSLRPHSQMLNLAEKAFQGQLKLILPVLHRRRKERFETWTLGRTKSRQISGRSFSVDRSFIGPEPVVVAARCSCRRHLRRRLSHFSPSSAF